MSQNTLNAGRAHRLHHEANSLPTPGTIPGDPPAAFELLLKSDGLQPRDATLRIAGAATSLTDGVLWACYRYTTTSGAQAGVDGYVWEPVEELDAALALPASLNFAKLDPHWIALRLVGTPVGGTIDADILIQESPR